ncbi:hypothetical protein ABZU92_18465 [Micromonospora arida]|uniref:hypothetical protein n=1 Tax=Micromonospora arida TaxID=2203715 RepID=UPI0033B93B29
MSLDYDPGLITAWPTTPAPKAGPLARLRDRFLGPTTDEHPGADTPNWEQELRSMRLDHAQAAHEALPTGRHHADNIPTTVIRRPAEICAVAYRITHDTHLGELVIGPLVPAHIHDQLAGAAR